MGISMKEGVLPAASLPPYSLTVLFPVFMSAKSGVRSEKQVGEHCYVLTGSRGEGHVFAPLYPVGSDYTL